MGDIENKPTLIHQYKCRQCQVDVLLLIINPCSDKEKTTGRETCFLTTYPGQVLQEQIS